MTKLAEVTIGQRSADLGSGDGRIVAAFAHAGAEAHGYEHNPKLIEMSREKIKEQHLEHTAFIHQQNFWDVSYSEFQIITVYGMYDILGPLEEKLLSELKPGTKVLLNLYPFPNWKPKEITNNVYLYVM